MSDENDNEKGKKNGADRDRSEPVIVDQSLFDFLEGLFYEQPAAHPERLEIRVVSGPKRDKYGPPVATYRFAPANASEEIIKKSPGRAKPKKEELVALSNKILAKMRQECDESRKACLFGLLAWNYSSGDEPYGRWIKHFEPKGRYGGRDGAPEEEDEESSEKKTINQILRHQEKMVETLNEAMMGIMDRQDRMNARLIEQNDRHMQRYERVLDLTERLMQADAKRKSEAAWDDIRQDAARRGLNLVSSIAPPLVGMLVAKPGTPQAANIEVKALQEFFKTTDDCKQCNKTREQHTKEDSHTFEPGRLTEEQSQAAFGQWSEEGQLTTPGVLTPHQMIILVRVANGQLPVSELDKLVPPHGEHAITMDQFMKLSQVIPLDQLLPLKIVFDNHTKKQGAA